MNDDVTKLFGSTLWSKSQQIGRKHADISENAIKIHPIIKP